MKIITWNINSVRLRIGLVMDLLAEQQPDIFAFRKPNAPMNIFLMTTLKPLISPSRDQGEKGYNGVAIISKAAA